MKRVIVTALTLVFISSLAPKVQAIQQNTYFQYYNAQERGKKIRGMDVSRWDGDVDYDVAKSKGLEFVIMKCSQGITSKDPRFTIQNINKIRALGLKCGVYHYAQPSVSGMDVKGARKEAEHFYNTLVKVYGNKEVGDLVPFLDFEDPNSEFKNDDAYDWIEAFSDRFHQLSGVRVGLYTAYYYIDSYANDGKELIHSKKGPISKKVPILWLAAHAPDSYKKLGLSYANYNFKSFGGYNKWTMWQYQSDAPDVSVGKSYGVESPDVDLDVLEGSINDILISRYNKPITGIAKIKEENYKEETKTKPKPIELPIDNGTSTIVSTKVIDETIKKLNEIEDKKGNSEKRRKWYIYTM